MAAVNVDPGMCVLAAQGSYQCLWRQAVRPCLGLMPTLLPLGAERYFFRGVSRVAKDSAAKMTPTPPSAPARMALCDKPISLRAINPSSNAVAVAANRPRI